ncbi:MAG TPA: glycosyltransferase [Candidatus Methylacidiphilales bacterium]|jgi:glycosyltransferase involved in cell wall biosynthesis|nr:glycosyltransferase [Candidatus Methylacidiphilales bacterium]
MKFSVLLNNYNYGCYLGAAIESVLRQTHADFELIIVDDGSTDDSHSVISRFKDPRIIPILKENGGQASAFKTGFARATADYVAFLDADDLWDSNKLERCSEILSRERDIVLLNHRYRNLGKTTAPETSALPPSGIYDLQADLRRHSTDLPLVPTSFFVGRLDECRQLLFDDRAWRIAADTPVIVGLALRGKVYNLSEILGSYRIHGSNLWSGRSAREQVARMRPGSDQPGVQGIENTIYLHYQRFYQLANENQARLGIKERFDFHNTDLALSYRILGTSRYSPQGIYWRLAKWLRRHALRS